MLHKQRGEWIVEVRMYSVGRKGCTPMEGREGSERWLWVGEVQPVVLTGMLHLYLHSTQNATHCTVYMHRSQYDNDIHTLCITCTLGCFRKTLFKENKKRNPPSISLELSLKGSKRRLISTKFRGTSSHFCFDHFYIVDFHLAPSWLREDWVKIYNAKMVKMEVARGNPKLCRKQKLFWIMSN